MHFHFLRAPLVFVLCATTMHGLVLGQQDEHTITSLGDSGATIPPETLPSFTNTIEYFHTVEEHEFDSMKRAYLANEERDRTLDETYLDFFRLAARWIAHSPGYPRTSEVMSRASALYRQGLRDPMFLGIYSQSYAKVAQTSPVVRGLVEEAWDSLEESQYPHLRKAALAFEIADYAQRWQSPDTRSQYLSEAFTAYIAAASDPDLPQSLETYLYVAIFPYLDDILTVEEAEDLCSLIRADQNVRPWIMHMAHGKLALRKGWDGRGGGYAASVTKEGWETFQRELNVAYEHLITAHSLAPNHPLAATELIGIAMAGHTPPDKDESYWLKEVLNSIPDWTPAYQRYLWNLRPRWGGSRSRMLQFGVLCAETKLYSTDVPYVLIEAMNDVAEESGEHREFWKKSPHLDLAITTLRELAAQAPHKEYKDKYLRSLAGIAWAGGQYQLATDANDQLGVASRNKPHLAYIDVVRAPISLIENEARVGSHPATQSLFPKLLEAARSKNRADFDSITRSMYSAASTDLELSNAVDMLVQRITPCFEISSEQPLRLDKHAFAPLKGSITSSGRGSIVAKPVEENGMYQLLAPTGQRFEISATIDTANYWHKHDANGGLFLCREHDDETEQFISVLIWPKHDAVSVAYRNNYNPSFKIDLDDNFNVLQVQVWDEYCVVRVNDVIVFRDRMPIGTRWRPGDSCGLQVRSDNDFGSVTFSDVLVRLLTEPPSELELHPEEARELRPKEPPSSHF